MIIIDLIKQALHAHDRGQERLQLPRESVDRLQKITDKMWYGGGRKKLQGTHYYTPLTDEKNALLGFAAFRKVGRYGRNRLLITTILAPNMRPKGDNIGNFFNASIPGIVAPHPNALPPFKGFQKVPDAKNRDELTTHTDRQTTAS